MVQSLFYLRHRNCGATSVGEYKWLIKYHQLSWWRKLATVKNFKAEVSKLLTVANLITLSCPQFFQKKQVFHSHGYKTLLMPCEFALYYDFKIILPSH